MWAGRWGGAPRGALGVEDREGLPRRGPPLVELQPNLRTRKHPQAPAPGKQTLAVTGRTTKTKETLSKQLTNETEVTEGITKRRTFSSRKASLSTKACIPALPPISSSGTKTTCAVRCGRNPDARSRRMASRYCAPTHFMSWEPRAKMLPAASISAPNGSWLRVRRVGWVGGRLR